MPQVSTTIGGAWAQKVDGNAKVQTLPGNPDTHLARPVISPTKCFDVIMAPSSGQGLAVRRLKTYNAAATGLVGAGPVLASTKYAQGTMAPVTLAYTADPVPFPVSNLVNDSGFYIGATEKFSVVKLVVGTARIVGGGGDTYVWSYWNGAAWVALTAYITDTPSWAAVATTYLTFWVPDDWAVGGTPVASVPTGQYNLRCQATAAPGTTAAVVTGVALARIEDLEVVPTTTSVNFIGLGCEPILTGLDEPLTVYWATANAGNWVAPGGSEIQGVA